MVTKMKCSRACVVAGSDIWSEHWWVFRWSSEKRHGQSCQESICPLENLSPSDTSWLLILSHPCATRNEYSMCVDAGRQADKGCSFWVAAGSHINQSKSSPSFSFVLPLVMGTCSWSCDNSTFFDKNIKSWGWFDSHVKIPSSHFVAVLLWMSMWKQWSSLPVTSWTC
jgi:hypothetical protein